VTVLAFEGVWVETTPTAALCDVTLDVPDRGITVVVGPSGAGKTTLLRLANRLEVPTRGTVRFRGEDVARLDPLELRRRVGMVFQRPTLFGGTVRDNLAVAAPGADDGTMIEALAQAGLAASFLDRVADELSGGEAQRACLARTLITEPEVLLMDEPTAALDQAPRTALEDQARALAARGVPILWVTHQLDQMRRLADHVVVLIGGRACHAGPRSGVERVDDAAARAFLEGGDDASG